MNNLSLSLKENIIIDIGKVSQLIITTIPNNLSETSYSLRDKQKYNIVHFNIGCDDNPPKIWKRTNKNNHNMAFNIEHRNLVTNKITTY